MLEWSHEFFLLSLFHGPFFGVRINGSLFLLHLLVIRVNLTVGVLAGINFLFSILVMLSIRIVWIDDLVRVGIRLLIIWV